MRRNATVGAEHMENSDASVYRCLPFRRKYSYIMYMYAVGTQGSSSTMKTRRTRPTHGWRCTLQKMKDQIEYRRFV